MKFRGKITDTICIKQFTSIVSTVAKLNKSCVLRITNDRVFFIIHETGSMGSQHGLWAELDQGHFFNEYNMEGVCPESNEIYLELEADKLSKTLNSLKSPQPARSLKIKLTRKHSPCLTLEAELPSVSVHARLVVHDVPVQLIPRKHWTMYKEPELPNFNASVYLPPLRQIRHVVERMRCLSNRISVSANRRGKLIVGVSTDTVKVNTHFKDLPQPVWENQEFSDSPPEELHCAVVDIKKLATFLHCDQMNPTKIICNIVGNNMVHLFLLHDDVTLQYYITGVSNA